MVDNGNAGDYSHEAKPGVFRRPSEEQEELFRWLPPRQNPDESTTHRERVNLVKLVAWVPVMMVVVGMIMLGKLELVILIYAMLLLVGGMAYRTKFSQRRPKLVRALTSLARISFIAVPLIVFTVAISQQTRVFHALVVSCIAALVLWWSYRRKRLSGRSVPRLLSAGFVLITSQWIWLQGQLSLTVLWLLAMYALGLVLTMFRPARSHKQYARLNSASPSPVHIPLVLKRYTNIEEARSSTIFYCREHWTCLARRLLVPVFVLVVATLFDVVILLGVDLASSGWSLAILGLIWLVPFGWVTVRFMDWYCFIRGVTSTIVFASRLVPWSPRNNFSPIKDLRVPEIDQSSLAARFFGYVHAKFDTTATRDVWLGEDFKYIPEESLMIWYLVRELARSRTTERD